MAKHETEAVLLTRCKYVLRLLKNEKKLSWRRIHVMPVLRGRFGRTKNTDMQGMEDLQIYLPGGRTLYCELKQAVGRATPEQRERQAELGALGHDYRLVRSVQELEDWLKECGVQHLSFQRGMFV